MVFIYACYKGLTDIVKLFLNDKRFNPADQSNKAFIGACYNGQFDIVKLLLNDKRVNPADQNNKAFIKSCINGIPYIVKLLLDNKRINPTDQNNKAFIESCYNQNINIIKLFTEYNIYHFDFDFENKEEFYFLKTVYSILKKDVNQYLTDICKENIIIKLEKHLISDKISTF
jgi:ankyrin repeat protein